MTPIVLCADDHGISPSVSAAIAVLAKEKRISATSCMVDFAEPKDCDALKPLFDTIDVGLHITFTVTRPLMVLMRDAYLRRLDRAWITSEVERQLDRFKQLFARPPAHIDGHQHVHILPIIRDAALEAAEKSGAYLRVTTDSHPQDFKSASLSMMSLELARRARERKIPINTAFRGTRSFREKASFQTLFKRMIDGAPAGAIVLCHPGLVDSVLEGRDEVTAAREEEFRYFKSEEFPADLAAADLSLARFKDAVASSPAR
ncbi:MAG: ChbG/HpnK family deacetylase [Proteobacteria bacterium]|nr:ChbG/HpnK family deacetylase [Pseudomonadota bacterium]